MSRTILVTDQAHWEQIANELRRKTVLGLDTESNSLHAYRERVCLIQIGTSEESYLVDPLAIDDLSSLGRLLADSSIVKVIHGCDYDLRSLNRDYGFTIQGLFDTQIAARFLGSTSPNLASVLEGSLGTSIPKSRRLQTSNWGSRPLSQRAIEYAANDVTYLVAMAENLRERLVQFGRLTWAEEECQRLEQTRYVPPAPPEVSFLRVKGSDRMTPRELAILREVFLAREEAAARLDCPPFQVVPNETLVEIAQTSASSSVSDLEPMAGPGITGPSPPGAGRWRNLLGAAIARGQQGPEYHREPRKRVGNPWTPESRVRLQRLKQWRTERGTALGLDPSLLWPTASLERWAQQAADGGFRRPPVDEPEVRAWQRREFGLELEAVARGSG